MVKIGISKLLRRISGGSTEDGSGHTEDSRRSSHSEQKQQEKQRQQEKQQYLLTRLGGMVVLGSIIQEFCRRAIEDERLSQFFAGVDPRVLTAHQTRFFTLAFTRPNREQAEIVIRRRHQRLFALGLSEVHFDVFTTHLEETLRDRGFGDAIVAEANAAIHRANSNHPVSNHHHHHHRHAAIVITAGPATILKLLSDVPPQPLEWLRVHWL
ncbi:Cyanobacterial globin family [Seminavis robusta]|uniref:Cyanobacterial globin family n=1 Tax=Seminavis robusta TaxID=568900 RepID=A0A9N8DG28_9STRA|nr:Cyanobacterial globin family [Seminavis robusta]|eukprot:Sro133_g063230.1 Cyanobacterial globin family (211) ;mRNA; r:100787-101419